MDWTILMLLTSSIIYPITIQVQSQKCHYKPDGKWISYNVNKTLIANHSVNPALAKNITVEYSLDGSSYNTTCNVILGIIWCPFPLFLHGDWFKMMLFYEGNNISHLMYVPDKNCECDWSYFEPYDFEYSTVSDQTILNYRIRTQKKRLFNSISATISISSTSGLNLEKSISNPEILPPSQNKGSLFYVGKYKMAFNALPCHKYRLCLTVVIKRFFYNQCSQNFISCWNYTKLLRDYKREIDVKPKCDVYDNSRVLLAWIPPNNMDGLRYRYALFTKRSDNSNRYPYIHNKEILLEGNTTETRIDRVISTLPNPLSVQLTTCKDCYCSNAIQQECEFNDTHPVQSNYMHIIIVVSVALVLLSVLLTLLYVFRKDWLCRQTSSSSDLIHPNGVTEEELFNNNAWMTELDVNNHVYEEASSLDKKEQGTEDELFSTLNVMNNESNENLYAESPSCYPVSTSTVSNVVLTSGDVETTLFDGGVITR